MTTKKNTKANAIKNKNKKLRIELFGEDSDHKIWDIDEKGFTSIPRTLPLIMSLFTEINENKNKNPGQVYLDLWCLSWDGAMVEIKSEEDRAYSCGYTTSRALRTWRERMSELVKFGFIEAKKKGNNPFGYVLIINPYIVIKRMIDDKKLPEHWSTAFLSRMNDIGVEFPVLEREGEE